MIILPVSQSATNHYRIGIVLLMLHGITHAHLCPQHNQPLGGRGGKDRGETESKIREEGTREREGGELETIT